MFTSDSGDDDSDSDSEDSIDINQRTDVYQPASHLRKAVNTKHNNGAKVAGAIVTTKASVKQQPTSLYSHARNKSASGNQRETSSNNNRRNKSKSSSSQHRAKHGIQSVHNRTAAAAGIAERKVLKHVGHSPTGLRAKDLVN